MELLFKSKVTNPLETINPSAKDSLFIEIRFFLKTKKNEHNDDLKNCRILKLRAIINNFF